LAFHTLHRKRHAQRQGTLPPCRPPSVWSCIGTLWRGLHGYGSKGAERFGSRLLDVLVVQDALAEPKAAAVDSDHQFLALEDDFVVLPGACLTANFPSRPIIEENGFVLGDAQDLRTVPPGWSGLII
jgi:hypothetical protein